MLWLHLSVITNLLPAVNLSTHPNAFTTLLRFQHSTLVQPTNGNPTLSGLSSWQQSTLLLSLLGILLPTIGQSSVIAADYLISLKGFWGKKIQEEK